MNSTVKESTGPELTWAWIGAGAVAQRYVVPIKALFTRGDLSVLRVHDLNEDAAHNWCAQLRKEGVHAVAARSEQVWLGASACVVATPPHTHLPWVREAAARRIPVLCEKPLVQTPSELAALAELRAAGAEFAVSQKYRYATLVTEACAYLRSGALGQLSSLSARFVSAAEAPGGWRTQAGGGGVWLDNAPHALDLLQMFWSAANGFAWETARACVDAVKSEPKRQRWVLDAQGQCKDALVCWQHEGVALSVEVAWGVAAERAPPKSPIFIAVGTNGRLEVTWQGWQHLAHDGNVSQKSNTSYDGAQAFAAVLENFAKQTSPASSEIAGWPAWPNYLALTRTLLKIHESVST